MMLKTHVILVTCVAMTWAGPHLSVSSTNSIPEAGEPSMDIRIPSPSDSSKLDVIIVEPEPADNQRTVISEKQINSTLCYVTSVPVRKRDDYQYKEGFGGYKLHTRLAPWNLARRTCENEGGHLAVINSAAEAEAISKIFKESPPILGSINGNAALIGIHDLFNEGEWLTLYGEPIERAGYTGWSKGQPDSYHGGEDCGAILKNGQLNDVKCTTPLGFFCEQPYFP